MQRAGTDAFSVSRPEWTAIEPLFEGWLQACRLKLLQCMAPDRRRCFAVPGCPLPPRFRD